MIVSEGVATDSAVLAVERVIGQGGWAGEECVHSGRSARSRCVSELLFLLSVEMRDDLSHRRSA